MKTMLCILSLTFAAFPSHAQDTNSIKAETLAKTTSSWNGAALPAYPEGQPEVTILKITIPPQSELPWHEHPFINAGILLSGEITVVAEGGETRHVKAGEALVELVNTWHHGVNDGTVPAEILVVYAGIKDMPVSVRRP